jgi:hypothetical protein
MSTSFSIGVRPGASRMSFGTFVKPLRGATESPDAESTVFCTMFMSVSFGEGITSNLGPRETGASAFF